MELTGMIGAASTVVTFLMFWAIVWWAYGGSRRQRFERDALAPFLLPDEASELESRAGQATEAQNHSVIRHDGGDCS